MASAPVVTEQELAAKRSDASELVEVGRRISQAHHQLVTGCADFADGPVWIADGEPTAAHWLAPRFDACRSTVRDWIRIGRALRGLGASAAAFETGEISYSKVRAMVSIATPGNEEELLEIARKTAASDISRELAKWSTNNEDDTVIDGRHRKARGLRSRNESDGTMATSLRLPPLAHGILDRAVQAQIMRRTMQREPDGNWPTAAQQSADALIELITEPANHRFEVLIHVDETGCYFPDGTPLTQSAVVGLFPDASIRTIVHDLEHKPVNASRARRFPTIRQKRVERANQPHCSRCGRTDLLITHHTAEHQHTGRTHTDELDTYCAPCHRQHHNS
ncbi:MAG: DUF222 domain-containing protein [Actinomycetia bacterium]|nr:DUF222 domain-containing protein [Actinomycetes bacterium]MCP4959721.1 DUF222 domain-containing protein [Actinomycetes bacterium]